MDIATLYQNYTIKISEIHLHQKLVRSVADTQLKALHEAIKASATGLSPYEAKYKMVFKSISGNWENFGFHKENAEDRIRSIQLQINSQYRWFLAEAYEAFEDFVEEAYAFTGFVNRDAWPLSDFGGITLNELANKDFDWLRGRAADKRDGIKSILARFRDKVPGFAELETKNQLEMNLKFAVQAIEMFRHIIVHHRGRVNDKTKFFDKIFEKCGNVSKKERPELEGFLNYYFGSGAHENTIFLLEIEAPSEGPFLIHYNRFEDLSRLLLAEAHLLFTKLRAQYP